VIPRRLASVGVALATALVLAGAAAQLANYGLGLDAAALDSSTDGGAFGLLGDVALASAAIAALFLARIRPRSGPTLALAALLIFLALDKALRLHDHVPDWPAYYLPVLLSTFLLLVRVGRRPGEPGRRLMTAGLLLLGLSLLVHFAGETALRTIGAAGPGWADEVKGVIKHGAEVEGWLLVALALPLAVRGRSAQPAPATAPERTSSPEHYLYESYLGPSRRSWALDLYYGLKPMLPRRVQLALRRAYARRQAETAFPAWPAERVLLDLRDNDLRRHLRNGSGPRLPFVGWWPEGRRFAVILTHDVEGPAGIENIPRVLEIERRHGFVSSWNFCAEWYPIPGGVFDAVRAAGCEVGLHGILHDGRLFRDRETFEANLPKIHRYMREWGASGFRSPATHRNADWMPELGCLYDTSFPDTDPFEPQPGGCCSIFPFFIDDLVELPITLVQDHTLFEILRDRSVERWVEKSEWIIERGGLVNLLVHPDYLLTEERLALYDEFLGFLAAQAGGWHALPRDVARWWKDRSLLECRRDERGEARIVGPRPAAGEPTVMWAEERDGRVAFDLASG
jgi:peptidoglycan/xylan/chitin deacetylase (PgdA/CDA1 family)